MAVELCKGRFPGRHFAQLRRLNAVRAHSSRRDFDWSRRRSWRRLFFLPPMTIAKSSEQLDQEKRAAARAALRWVRSGMTLGLGSGTTAQYFVTELGAMAQSRQMRLSAVASSEKTEELARVAGIPLIAPCRGLQLDLTVDGADEIAPDLGLIKGRGGALLREKVLARASRQFLVIADSSKRVARLGA